MRRTKVVSPIFIKKGKGNDGKVLVVMLVLILMVALFSMAATAKAATEAPVEDIVENKATCTVTYFTEKGGKYITKKHAANINEILTVLHRNIADEVTTKDSKWGEIGVDCDIDRPVYDEMAGRTVRGFAFIFSLK